MLSRTAENLYWTARYVERADSIARLLEVAYRIHLIPNTEEGYMNEWESILQASGIKQEYLKAPNITKNTPTKPHEPGRPTDANMKIINTDAKKGKLLTRPP